MRLESLKGEERGSGVLEHACYPHHSSPKQGDQELEVTLECVEKPHFATETETTTTESRQEES